MRILFLILALGFLLDQSQAYASESTKILKSIKQLEESYKEGSAEKLFKVITSMKGLNQDELKKKAKEDAKKHKGFVSGQTYSKKRMKIDRDLAIAFSDHNGVGPLFLIKINEKWKIIIDWSLPNPVGTSYSKNKIESMKQLYIWHKDEVKSNKKSAN